MPAMDDKTQPLGYAALDAEEMPLPPSQARSLASSGALEILKIATNQDTQLANSLAQEFMSSLLTADGSQSARKELAERLQSLTNLSEKQAEFFVAQFCQTLATELTNNPVASTNIKSASLKTSDYRDWVQDGKYIIPECIYIAPPQHYQMILKSVWNHLDLESHFANPERVVEITNLPKPYLLLDSGTLLNDRDLTEGDYETDHVETQLLFLRDCQNFIPEIDSLKKRFNRILENLEYFKDVYQEVFEEYGEDSPFIYIGGMSADKNEEMIEEMEQGIEAAKSIDDNLEAKKLTRILDYYTRGHESLSNLASAFYDFFEEHKWHEMTGAIDLVRGKKL